MKKTSIAIVAVLLAVLMLAGCTQTTTPASSAPAASAAAVASSAAPASSAASTSTTVASASAVQGKKLQITFVSPLIGLPVWLNAKYGAEAAGKQFNAEVNWVGPDKIDIDAQVKQVEQATAENVDGIICCPLNPTAFTDVYKAALAKNIPIINTAVDSDSSTRTAYIGTDYTNFGTQAAEALAKKMNGKANIAVIQTSMDSGNQNAERQAFEAVIKQKYPNMKILVTETDQSDQTKAVDKINALIDGYSDLNAIWCVEAASGPAAGQVLKERKLTDKITVLAIDDTDDVLGAISEGSIWGTMTQDFFKMGFESVKMIRNYADGKKDNVSIPPVQDSGTTLVTKDNLEQYKNRNK